MTTDVLAQNRMLETRVSRNSTSALQTGLMVGMLTLIALHGPQVHAGDDGRFRASFTRQYEQVKALAPDMVVLELRDRIELVASRGSQVSAASNERRVRGFESALLRNLEAPLCRNPPPSSPPTPGVIAESVQLAASTQSLRVNDEDVAELSALTQRLVDSLTPARWCELKSLDEVQ